MEGWFATAKFEVCKRFATRGEVEDEPFDSIEVFYSQQFRPSGVGYLSLAGLQLDSSLHVRTCCVTRSGRTSVHRPKLSRNSQGTRTSGRRSGPCISTVAKGEAIRLLDLTPVGAAPGWRQTGSPRKCLVESTS